MGRRLLGCVRDRLGQSSGADHVTLTVSLRGAVTDRGAPRVPWKCLWNQKRHTSLVGRAHGWGRGSCSETSTLVWKIILPFRVSFPPQGVKLYLEILVCDAVSPWEAHDRRGRGGAEDGLISEWTARGSCEVVALYYILHRFSVAAC